MMIDIENIKQGDTVYFLNDLSEFGGKKFIGKALIESINDNRTWIKLLNDYHHKPKELFLKIEEIPNYQNLKIFTY